MNVYNMAISLLTVDHYYVLLFLFSVSWDIGEWSECSKTCGLGMQHRQVLCRQVYANRTLMVQQYRCHHLEKPETTSTCQLKICSEWQIQTEWTSVNGKEWFIWSMKPQGSHGGVEHSSRDLYSDVIWITFGFD